MSCEGISTTLFKMPLYLKDGGGGKFVCVSGSCGCVGFALLMILEFHPLLCAFSALWQICRLYTQKCAEFLCVCQFPIHFLWSVIFDRRAQM